MQNHIGLYYPYIHFRNESWLKLSVLYWDQMARTVPNDHSPFDTDTVRRLTQELNFITNLHPVRELEKIANLFGELLDLASDNTPESSLWLPPNLERPNSNFLDRYRVTETRNDLVSVYCSKVAYKLRDRLIDERLAVESEDFSQLRMHPKLAAVYMTALAKEMAASRQFAPVAEEDQNYVAIAGNTVEDLSFFLLTDDDQPVFQAQYKPALAERMAYIAIESILPTNIEAVPLSKIIDARKRFGAELHAFQSQFHSIVTDADWLLSVTDPTALRDHMQSLSEKTILTSLNDLKRGLASLGILTTGSAIAAQIAVPKDCLGGIPGSLGLEPTLTSVGALVIATLPVIATSRAARRKMLASSPATYLLHLEQELSPKSMIDRLQMKVSTFFSS
jgi:hypothetical protein